MVLIDPKKNRPQCPKANSNVKITEIPTSPAGKEETNITCTLKINEEKYKEDLKNSFDKLAISADNYGFYNLSPVYNFEYRNKTPECNSDSEGSSSDVPSDDEDVIAKGIEDKTKKYKQNRSTPYSGPIEYNNRNHCSGGTLLVDHNLQHNYYRNNLKVPLTNINPDERNEIDNLVTEIDDKFTAEDLDKVFSAMFYSEPSSQVEDIPQEDVTIVSKTADADSAYDSSSPYSSISNSPMPNAYCNHEYSSFSDCQPPNINPLPDFLVSPNNFQEQFKAPPQSVKTQEESRPLNIPLGKTQMNVKLLNPPPQVAFVNRQHPVLPNFQLVPHYQQKNLAPESVEVVLEKDMNISAEIRLKKIANAYQMEVQWVRILKDVNFFQVDTENETKVIKHLKSKNNPKLFNEILIALLERIKYEKETGLRLLKSLNFKGESALSIALFECTDKPLVARYIIETMKHLNDDVDLVDSEGNTLLHRLVMKGDKFAKIIAELLNTKFFDVNKKNNLLQTPLYVAAKHHDHPTRFCTLIVSKLLMKHNASVLISDSNGMTPIHTVVQNSCDPQLLKALLSHEDIVLSKRVDVKKDHYGNTALHYAANRYDLPIELQAKIMKQLKDCGWSLTTKNLLDKTPLILIPDDRKQRILDYINMK